MKTKIALVIPCYRFDANFLKELLQSVTTIRVIFVNDGNPRFEFTKIFCDYPHLEIIHHEKNLGKGEAIFSAIKYLEEQNLQGLVFADADGQHAISDIQSLINRTLKCEDELMLMGARTFRFGVTPFRNWLGNLSISILTFFITGRFLSDTQCGLRFVSFSFLKKIPRHFYAGYETEFLMLLIAFKKGVKVSTHSIQTIYHKKNLSSFRPLKDSWRILKSLFYH